MDSDSIERFAVGFLLFKFSVFAGLLLVRLYQSGRLGSFCFHLGCSLLLHYLREEKSA